MKRGMSMKDKISVIVAIYNVAPYLEKCIKSIINQNYNDLQIILVDDGSTDNSGEICDSFALLDSRIKVIHKENGGLVSARSAGLAAATGRYVGFVDGDDWLEDTMYQKLHMALTENQVDIVYGGLMYCNENGKKINMTCSLMGMYQLGADSVSYLSHKVFDPKEPDRMYAGYIYLAMFKTDFAKQAYSHVPLSCEQGEDLICLTWMLLHANSIFFIDDVIYNYRYRHDSISKTPSPRKYIQICRMIEAIENICRECGCWGEVRDYLEDWLNAKMINDIQMVNPCLYIERYNYPHIEQLRGKRILLYGAGAVGKNYYGQLSRFADIQIVAWADANALDYDYEYAKVIFPSQISEYAFDLILIAVKEKKLAEGIKICLNNMGYADNQLLWETPKRMP